MGKTRVDFDDKNATAQTGMGKTPCRGSGGTLAGGPSPPAEVPQNFAQGPVDLSPGPTPRLRGTIIIGFNVLIYSLY